MPNCKNVVALVATIAAIAFCGPHALSQQSAPASILQVHVVITDAAFRNDEELPPLQKEDLQVKQGKEPRDIKQLIPAQADHAALQLMILIDDVLDPTRLGNSLNDIREFIQEQPSSAVVGVAYMSNTGFKIEQNFTADHGLAAKAVRLPRGNLSTMDSPYLSLISLLKRWPQQNLRREVIMVSDGIDRLRGENPELSSFGPVYHSMPTISNDATSASEVSQRYNVIVFPIYSPGVGRAARSAWDLELGLSGMTKIADETGGECFSLSTTTLVSFKPYLDRIYRLLNNQYFVVFNAQQGKKDSLAPIKIDFAEGKNSEIYAPDNVWVPAALKEAR